MLQKAAAVTEMGYYAHSDDSVGQEKWQRLSEHLEGVGKRGANFLEAAGCADFGRVAGLLHDLGKYAQEFQEHLKGKKKRVVHATAGAEVALERYGKKLGKMLAFCIAGHHAGLANGVSGGRTTALSDRLKGAFLKPVSAWKNEIALPPSLSAPPIKPRDKQAAAFSAAFLTRMVFSALVDADRLDTESWYARLQGTKPMRGGHPGLGELRTRLNRRLGEIGVNAEASKVNDLRQKVLNHARGKATRDRGLFTLTVPTGGGKTLTSLAFALDHAAHHGLKRIIYVIPFTSIVEQTASVFRKALRGGEDDGTGFIIEHHSAFDEGQIDEKETEEKSRRLAMENWDASIIVTTAVQFFESLFANRPSRCRKLHNIANSVVILDEAQTLPLKLLKPCMAAIDELARNWRASVVLCTATQPALTAESVFSGERGFPGGFEGVRELAPDPQSLYQEPAFKRARICQRKEPMDDTQLAEQLRGSQQALCVVNTRRHARELYESIKGADGACHLTTTMYANHRKEKLEEVKQRLKENKPVRLVATSLVEAGVDFDFPVVWRAEAGLESIIQAAGRCNREGRQSSICDVFVFTPAEGEGRKPPLEIKQFAEAACSVMRHYDDPLSLEAIEGYFQELYWLKGEKLDAEGILKEIGDRRDTLDFPFETIAKKFQMIKTAMVPVIIRYRRAGGDDDRVKEVEKLLDELRWVKYPGRIARHLQPYVVTIPQYVRNALRAAGAVEVIREEDFAEQFVVLSNRDLYRDDVGLMWDDPTFREAEANIY